ncbi:hypothetical protein DERF_008464 [Dermatophagoides farinae]|uniref:Uncharacterized protein n=1 Tax=Dermatophagoides farinae TaxID=6954 RepID=A0A922L4S8_DERFA|nr:hypothetical protein DERF_008464 [Dermatophagoides farinae]
MSYLVCLYFGGGIGVCSLCLYSSSSSSSSPTSTSTSTTSTSTTTNHQEKKYISLAFFFTENTTP